MDNDLHAAFGDLSPSGKARVLARVIHLETIHVRDIHDRFPNDSERLYASSEFIHRLSNGIIGALNPVDGGRGSTEIDLILRTYAPRGQYFLERLREWMVAEV